MAGGGCWGWVGNRRQVKATIKRQTAVVCVQYVAQTATIHRMGQDSHWLQFGTTHILINAIQWLHRPSVKADLAIYTHVLDVPG